MVDYFSDFPGLTVRTPDSQVPPLHDLSSDGDINLKGSCTGEALVVVNHILRQQPKCEAESRENRQEQEKPKLSPVISHGGYQSSSREYQAEHKNCHYAPPMICAASASSTAWGAL